MGAGAGAGDPEAGHLGVAVLRQGGVPQPGLLDVEVAPAIADPALAVEQGFHQAVADVIVELADQQRGSSQTVALSGVGNGERLQKLGIDVMRKRFDTGATPVREALNRLTAEGLVTFRDLRGFYVVDLDADELIELFHTRTRFFAFIIREAISHGDAA